jgi:putative phosphoribosyl transferase
MRFHDRTDAGQQLAQQLGSFVHRPDVLVLGLPRGGVPVAYAVARALQAPLDVLIVRKLGVPGEPELAMGAIASGGVRVINDDVVAALGITQQTLEEVTEREQQELLRRERLYRGDRPPPDIYGRTVILVDDGIATGATIRAAIALLRRQRPARLVVAVPVAAASTCAELQTEVDEVVCVLAPENFYGVGLWYDEFPQTTDQEIQELLQRAHHEQGVV